jgi:RNA polymerase sigma-70 factor, ECF subfamily
MEMVYRLQEQFGSGLAVDDAPVALGRWRRVGGDCGATGFDPSARRRSTQHVPARGQIPSLDSLSDESLVHHIRKGNARAGEVLLERYGEPVMRYLRRIASPALAEDLYQQTWLGVIEHLNTFKTATSPGGFKSWLFRIATNKVNDLWRSRGREKAAKEGFARNIDQEVEEAGVPVDVSEQVEELRRYIERLPEKQRQVLTLRYFADMKFVDIADLLDCPLNTALGHAHKGMTKLRRWLEAA